MRTIFRLIPAASFGFYSRVPFLPDVLHVEIYLAFTSSSPITATRLRVFFYQLPRFSSPAYRSGPFGVGMQAEVSPFLS